MRTAEGGQIRLTKPREKQLFIFAELPALSQGLLIVSPPCSAERQVENS